MPNHIFINNNCELNNKHDFFNNFFINAGSLFDFDLTFVAELLLFIILALVVTNKFIGPVSKEINERAEFINYTLENQQFY